MKTYTRLIIAGPACVTLTLTGVSVGAAAPAMLTNAQLDMVTAGSVTVKSSADGGAIGALTIAGTTTNSFALHSGQQNDPGAGISAGVADGTALAVGTNVGIGTGPTGAATNVTTAGAADGNIQLNSTINYTVRGAGGVQFQAGWTAVYGAWTGV